MLHNSHHLPTYFIAHSETSSSPSCPYPFTCNYQFPSVFSSISLNSFLRGSLVTSQMLVLKTSDFSSSTLAPQSENQKSNSSKSFRKMNKINNNNNTNRQLSEGEQLPAREKCPRCESTNTKFCYYNNYSKSQPRHFCRSCKRHWTLGGTLRAVPVGGASKNKRLKTANPSNASVAAPSNTSNGGEFPLIPALPDLPRSQMFPLSVAAAGSSPSSFDSLGQSSSVVDYVNETLVEVPGVSVAGQPWESSWSWGDLDALLSGGGLGVPYDDDYYEIFRP